MWGVRIGFGRQPYRAADGKERAVVRRWACAAQGRADPLRLTYYGSNTDLLERLGPHTTGKGCLYVKRLDDLDREVLTDLVRRAWETNHEQPC